MKKVFLIFVAIFMVSCGNLNTQKSIKSEYIHDVLNEYVQLSADFDTDGNTTHKTMKIRDNYGFQKMEFIYSNDSVVTILNGERMSSPRGQVNSRPGSPVTNGNILIDIYNQSGMTYKILEYDKYGNWTKLSFLDPEKNKTIILYRLIYYY